MADTQKVRGKPKPADKKAAAAKRPGGEQSAMEPQRPPVEDFMATRLLRDTAVREKVYRDRITMIIMGIALIASIFANVMLATRKPDIKYFATNANGGLLRMVALNQPISSRSDVLSWATSAITQAYTYDFANFRKQFQESSNLFTTSGWEGFLQALDESGNLKSVQTNKFVTTVVPKSAPVIVGTGYVEGRYAWKIEIPIIVTYQSATKRVSQNLLVQAVIVRRSELEHPKGLGIAQIVAQ